MKRLLVSSFLVVCMLQAAPAQVANLLDSLRGVIGSKERDADRLNAYVQLSGRLSMSSFNESIKTAEEGFTLASKLKDSVAYGQLCRNMGVANYFKGDYERATERFYLAAGIFERRGKRAELAVLYNDIAKLYRKLRDLERANAMYDKAMELFQVLNDSSGIQMVYNESGVVYEYMGNYREALRRYQASLRYATLRNDEMGKSWCYNFIAGVYLLQNKFILAEDYHIRALSIRQREKDTFALTLSYSDLGELYSNWGKYDMARYYYDQSNFLAEKMEYKELLSNNYAKMSKMANMMGNYKEALDFFTWHTQLKDSIFSNQKTRQIEEISTIYETNKREQQIELQQLTIRKRNIQLLAIAGLALLIAAGAWLFYKRYQWKQELTMQQELARQQELSTQAILEAEEKERTRIAKDLHDSVGQMMSAARMNLSSYYNQAQPAAGEQEESLRKIIRLVDDSCREVRAVSHSMMPAAMMKRNLPEAIRELINRIESPQLRIHFHTEGEPGEQENQTSSILYRVIQECVNNVIKHAGASELDIALLYDHEGISVTIEDNGKGFNLERLPEGAGIGLQNMRARVEFLKGTIEFDSSPGNGTLVAIHLPAAQPV